MQLHIVSLNIHFGKKIEAIARKIQQNPNLAVADIFFIQEIEYRVKERVSRAEKLAQMLGMHYVYIPSRTLGRIFHKGSHGLAILSRYKLTNIEAIQLPYFKLPYRARNRIAIAATVTILGQSIRLYNVHLDMRLTKKQRVEQLLPVLKQVHEQSVERAVIAGDFNTLSVLWSLGALPAFYQNQNRYLDNFLKSFGFEVALNHKPITFDRGGFKWSLDHIYVKGAEVERAGVESEMKISDHKPVWAKIIV